MQRLPNLMTKDLVAGLPAVRERFDTEQMLGRRATCCSLAVHRRILPMAVASTHTLWFCLLASSAICPFDISRAAEPPAATSSVRSFKRWDGFRNRLLPDRPSHVVQDFGYSESSRAGGRTGEIGGRIQRSLKLSRYGKKLERQLTLDDEFAARGRLAVTRNWGSSGALVGWYHTSSQGWRTSDSLAFRVDGNGDAFWVFYEYGTHSGRTGGGGAFEGERYQSTPTPPFPVDGTVHDWTLAYDPDGGNGSGLITFRIDDRSYRLPVRADDRADGATFDHFGIWNQQTTGDAVELWLDDLVVDGERWSFDADPRWRAEGNRKKYVERVVRPFHDFGAVNGDVGHMGGVVWRDEAPAYYADRISPRSLDDV
ncbi:MAG: hypothetical protein AAF961_17755, partial [Planctomycetota bacterium]